MLWHTDSAAPPATLANVASGRYQAPLIDTAGKRRTRSTGAVIVLEVAPTTAPMPIFVTKPRGVLLSGGMPVGRPRAPCPPPSAWGVTSTKWLKVVSTVGPFKLNQESAAISRV